MKCNLCSLCDTLKLKVKGFYITHVLIPLAYRWTSKLRILSDFDSIQYVLDHHCSVSRYGDGEFGILRGIGNGFQTPNSALAKRLAEVLESDPADHKNFMIDIPLPIKDLVGLEEPKKFWPLSWAIERFPAFCVGMWIYTQRSILISYWNIMWMVGGGTFTLACCNTQYIDLGDSYVSLFDVVTRDAFTFLSLSGICLFLSIY